MDTKNTTILVVGTPKRIPPMYRNPQMGSYVWVIKTYRSLCCSLWTPCRQAAASPHAARLMSLASMVPMFGRKFEKGPEVVSISGTCGYTCMHKHVKRMLA